MRLLVALVTVALLGTAGPARASATPAAPQPAHLAARTAVAHGQPAHPRPARGHAHSHARATQPGRITPRSLSSVHANPRSGGSAWFTPSSRVSARGAGSTVPPRRPDARPHRGVSPHQGRGPPAPRPPSNATLASQQRAALRTLTGARPRRARTRRRRSARARTARRPARTTTPDTGDARPPPARPPPGRTRLSSHLVAFER